MAERLVDGTVAVGPEARSLGEFLLAAPSPGMRPVFRWYRSVTSGLMPAQLRAGFGLPWRARDRATFAASRALIGAGYRAMPAAVRQLPAYLDARARLEQRRSGPMGRLIGGLAFRLAVRGIG